MEQYIPKDAIMAEIERLAEVKPIDEFQPQVQNKIDWLSGKLFAINSLRVFLDTLEVKDVDLEKEIHLWMEDNTCGGYCSANIRETAEHFYELGLKVQSKDMIEALRTEYEKGRADVIADTLSWLSNVWPQYCSDTNIIDAYKEGVVKD